MEIGKADTIKGIKERQRRHFDPPNTTSRYDVHNMDPSEGGIRRLLYESNKSKEG